MNKKKIGFILTIVLIVCIILGFVLIKKNNSKKDIKHNYELIKNNNEYVFNIIKATNKYQNSNYLISPYSIEIALNMLGEGANGNTKREIFSILPRNYENIKLAKNRISIANALFIKDEFENYISKSYSNKIKDNYAADIIYDEFTTPDKINNWVNEKTYEMIPSILDDIDKDFVLGIGDALAIDVNWLYKFECHRTVEDTFTKSNGDAIKVEMMNNDILMSKKVKYIQNDEIEGIMLPYISYDEDGNEIKNNDNHLDFIAIMPNKDTYDYVSKLNNSVYDKINNEFKAANKVNINLAIPRFAYDFDLENFKEVLSDMGIKDVFDSEKSDLSNIMSRDNMNKLNIDNLFVNQAIHKTHIDLNEEGTKAAAVTYFGIAKNSSIQEPNYETININFNKPFMYFIRDNKTMEILFFGVVNFPNEWKGTTCS